MSCFTRTKQKHGGVCIYAHTHLYCLEIHEVANISLEMDCELCGIYLPKINVIIITAYRSPTANVTTFMNLITTLLESLLSKYNPQSRVILTGDFNIDTSKQTGDSIQLINTMAGFSFKKLWKNEQGKHQRHHLQ